MEKKPFNFFPRGERTILTILNSVKLVEFKRSLGLPVGNKNQFIQLPEIIGNQPANFLQGIADTDFCVYFRDYNKDGLHEYPRVEASFCNTNLANAVKSCLEKVGIKYYSDCILRRNKFEEHRIRIEGKNSI